MAHYEYQGQHYELPDGLDNATALSKIKTHLGQSTSATSPDEWDKPYQEYVSNWKYDQTKPLIPGEPRSTTPLLSKEDWRSTKDTEWLKNMGGAAVAGVEQGLNLLGGTGGAIVAPLAAGTKWVSNKLIGQPGQFERDYSDLFNAAASTGTQLVDATGFDNKGRTRVNQAVGNIVNNLLLPMAGHGQVSPIPEVSSKPINIPKRTSTGTVPKDTAGTKLAAEFAKNNAPTPEDLGTQLARDRYNNDRTVERLQHALDKQNNPIPPISVDAQGRAWTGEDVPVKRQWDAQVAVEERQAALERQMQLNVEEQRRRQLQGPTASELEAQPTGHEAWAEGQRQAANQRLPGSNDPLDLGPSVLRKAEQYPDVKDYPDLLQEAPYQYEGGIDWPTAEQKALPITVADIVGRNSMPEPDPFNRVSSQQTANRILARGPNTPEATQARTNMARTAHDTFGQTGGMGKRQRGQVDPDLITLGLTKLFHGGREFTKWDPRTIGKGEGMSALGPGLYTGDNPQLAGIYRKYGDVWDFNEKGDAVVTKPGVVNELAVDTKHFIDFSKKMSADQAAKLEAAHSNLEALGIGYKREYGFNSAFERAKRYNMQQEAREAMVQAGIDGRVTNLGGKLGREIVIYNPDIIAQISRTDVPVEKTDVTQYLNKGMSRGQRGALDVDSIVKGLQNLSHKSVDFLDKRERILMSAIGDNSFILHPGDPAKAIETALAEGKDGKGWALTQSGLGMYAEKNNSALARYVARSLSYANNVFVKSNKDFIDPVERALRHISRDKQTMIDLNEVMKVEQQARRRATPEELANSGLNEKAIQAYTSLRKAMDESITRANAAREKLGLDPVTPEQAYYSSMQQGNWQLVGYALDEAGNPTVLSHYSRVLTRGEGNKAIAWINKNRPEVVKTKLEYVPINDLKGVPRDVFGTYKAMADIFKDTPMEQQMHEMMQQATTEQAFNERGFSKHFLTKGNIPGFIGDRPWLDPYENAKAGMKAQIQYLKDANRWIPLQDALAGIKEVISNRELQDQQPNNIAMSRAYMVNALGGTKSWFDGLSHDFSRAAGVSPGQARKYIADLKNLTYLQLIGGSTGYSLATPLQALVLGPAYHVKEGAIPFKEYLPIYGKTLMDSWQILMSHEVGNLTGKDISNAGLTKLSPLAKEAMRYMEDNNVISRNWFDEHAELGTHPAIELANKTGGMTITGPEKIARTLTFMSFVHHLEAQGKLKGLELFKRADELTNHTLTNFDRNARPLIADKMGNIGELAYTFKGPIFQYYNSLIGFTKLGFEKNNWKPLGTALLMTGLLGGIINLPGIQEYDSLSNMLKKLISYVHPEWAKNAEDAIPNVKEFALKHLPDAVTYGTVSAATNIQMASRFSTQVIDPSRPLDNFAPVAQEVKEQLALLNNIPIIGNPSRTSMAEGIWQNMPPLIKGQMEYHNAFDAFKVPGKRPDGTQGAYNPNNLKDRGDTYQRTQADWNRRAAGLTSLDEARFKDARYATTQRSQRMKIAQDSALENLVDKIVMQKSTNDQTYKKDIRKYAVAYFENEGDENTFKSELDKRLIKAFTTPEERNLMRANSVHEVMNIKRMMDMNRGKYAN